MSDKTPPKPPHKPYSEWTDEECAAMDKLFWRMGWFTPPDATPQLREKM